MSRVDIKYLTDEAGNKISPVVSTDSVYNGTKLLTEDYIKSITAIGTTVTYTKGDGTTGTFTTQDQNVDFTTTNPTVRTQYYVPFTSRNRGACFDNDGLKYVTLEGTTSTDGEAQFVLGNSTAIGTAGNKRGSLVIYSSNSYYGNLAYDAEATSNNQYTLAGAGGTILSTGNYSSWALPLSGGTMSGTITCRNITPGAYKTYSIGNNTSALSSICSNIFYVNNGSGASTSSSYAIQGTTSGISCNGNIRPATDSTHNLGNSSAYWANVYADRIEFNNSGHAYITTFWGTHLCLTCPTSAGAIRGLLDTNTSTYAPFQGSAFTVLSSKRYKENIELMTEEEANKLDNIEVVTFDYKNKGNGTNCRGVIAEQVEDYIPYAVMSGTDTEGNYHEIDSVDYNRFVPYLIKKNQMLTQELNEVKEELKIIKNSLNL